MIKEFQKEYRWLSNFAPVQIKIGRLLYPSVEHAYMSMKSNNKQWKLNCSIFKGKKPGQIKRESRTIKLRPDWDDIKLQVMEDCLHQKFSQEPYRINLLRTGNKYIQEGNYWNDVFWGICLKTGKGKNHLGKLIMQIRTEIKNQSVSSAP